MYTQFIRLIQPLLLCVCLFSLPLISQADSLSELIQQAETYRAKGYLNDAAQLYQQIQTQAQAEDQHQYAVLAKGQYAYVLFLKRDYAQAEPLLQQAFLQARSSGWPLLAAIQANHLGNLHAAQKADDQAAADYQNALHLAEQANDPALLARIQTNRIRLMSAGQPQQAWGLLQTLTPTLTKLKPDNERLDLMLTAAYQVLHWPAETSITLSQRQALASALLTPALALAKTLKQPRSLSMAHAYWGQLHEVQGNPQAALSATDAAITAMQNTQDRDLLVQWEWQRGRLLKTLGREAAALSAYRRSVDHIEAVRNDIPVEYQAGRSSFRETLQPVYLGLADLLIRQSDQAANAESRQALLNEARNTVELIKKTELEDYFQNRCLVEFQPDAALESVSPQTAALYPVLLEDRLELLLSLPDGLVHQTVAVPASQVEATARKLARILRYNKKGFVQPSKQLYDWLIRPVAGLLQQHKIKTLVFIPDGPLRLVPLAALYGDDRYVAEQYAVVTSPGLKLFDPQPFKHQGISALLAGMSEPGAVIQTLPDVYLQPMLNAISHSDMTQRGGQTTRDLGLVLFQSSGADQPVLAKPISRALLKNPATMIKLKAMLALPGVEAEIEDLSKILPSTRLLNETYIKKRIEQEVQQSPFRIVHLATHGVFADSAADSFIMAHDQILTIDKLEGLLDSEIHKNQPIELLTLSACQTAAGNDRSPLGFSGVAIRSKVRSVLGALWSIDDQATVTFMKAFYQQLTQPGTSKVQALQAAQLHMLNKTGYRHPYYWSPLVLVGSWL